MTTFQERYGPWAIVTGASSGIGEAFAHELAARGLRSILVARREHELRRVAQDIRTQYGIECEIVALDIAAPEFMGCLVRAVADRDIGLVIGNAAFNPAGEFRALSVDTLQRVLDVNIRANVLLVQNVVPRLAARGRGGIALVASLEGFFGMPYSACYSASKAFVLTFGEALWGEVEELGIDVLVVAPGATDTPLLASRRLEGRKLTSMSPKAVAQSALDHLGHGPVVIPGFGNKWIVRILRRLPRRWVVRKAGVAMRSIVKNLSDV